MSVEYFKTLLWLLYCHTGEYHGNAEYLVQGPVLFEILSPLSYKWCVFFSLENLPLMKLQRLIFKELRNSYL